MAKMSALWVVESGGVSAISTTSTIVSLWTATMPAANAFWGSHKIWGNSWLCQADIKQWHRQDNLNKVSKAAFYR